MKLGTRKLRKTLVIGTLLALELALLLGLAWRLGASTGAAYGAMEGLSILAVVLLISSRENPSYKLAWIVVILVFPLFGVIIYLLAGTPSLSPRLRRQARAERNLRAAGRPEPRDGAALRALREFCPSCARQALFLRSLTGRALYCGGKARLLTPGEAFFDALLEALRSARRFIFLEFFILAQGSLLDELMAVLRDRAAHGVEVRLLYDDAGCMDDLPPGFASECARAGIRAAAFNPFLPVLDKFMAYRDHRKIVVIDGAVGFTGGMNVADEYVNRIELHGHWKDTGVELRGEAVRSLTDMFLEMWGTACGKTEETAPYFTPCPADAPRPENGFLLPFHDSPFLGNAAQGSILELAGASLHTLYIMTPYLILDSETVLALCNAARGGVDVRIITPHVADKRFVHAVTRGSYAQLMEAGVCIYEYTPGFIHSKTVLSDGLCGLVGSVNMDFRSFYLQYEDAVWFCGGPLAKELAEDFEKTFAVSLRIDPARWKKRPLAGRLAAVFLRLFAPLM